MSAKDKINNLLVVFSNPYLTDREYQQFSMLYDFTSEDLQTVFNTTLYIIRHRLRSSTQTAYNNEDIMMYAKSNSLSMPFDLRDFNRKSTEIFFGAVE